MKIEIKIFLLPFPLPGYQYPNMMQISAPDCQTTIFAFPDLSNVDNACNVLTLQVFKLLTIKTPHL